MTIFESIALVLAILVIAAAIAYFTQMGQPLMKDLIDVQKQIKPVIDQIETIAQDVTSEVAKDSNTAQTIAKADIDKVVKIAKTLPQDAQINLAQANKATNKKKYYPTKPKTQK